MKKALFNSVGSNYNVYFALKALFMSFSSRHRVELVSMLSERYGGETHLFYKGREAIQAALVTAQLPEKSEVLITGYTCYAVYKAVVDAGHQPVFLDIAEDTLNYNATILENAIKKHPSAAVLILQNTLGFASEAKQITELARQNKILVIEDLAHCIGLEYRDGREAGTIGDFTALSFSQDKVVDGISGGALVIRAKRYQNKVNSYIYYTRLPFRRQLTDRLYPIQTVFIRAMYAFKVGKAYHAFAKRLGLLAKPVDGVFGKYRALPNWYCGLIMSQFKHLPALARRRKAISEIYAREISEKYQIKPLTGEPIYLRFPIIVQKRQALFNYLKQDNIYITDIWYESPVAPIRYMPKTDYKIGECPRAEKLAEVMVNLPTHQAISFNDARKLARKVEAWLSKTEK